MADHRQTFMAIATVVAVGSFAASHWIEASGQDPTLARLQQQMSQRREEQDRIDRELETVQRRLGCRGDVRMGICMDAPCVDSDAAGELDPRYVRGSVTFFEPFGPHRTVEDACTGPSELREGTCVTAGDGGAPRAEFVVIQCERGCRDGACLR